MDEDFWPIEERCNTAAASRSAGVSDDAAFVLSGRGRPGHLIEFGPTAKMFKEPSQKERLEYVTGRFG